MDKTISVNKKILTIIIVALTISPAFALGEGNRNLLLIGVMGISPLIILRFLEFDKYVPLLITFMCAIVFTPWLNHPETMRWSTVMYSAMFCLTFIAYSQLLYYSGFTRLQYLVLLKYIIFAYMAVLLIQQFCVLAGLPIVNLSNYNPQEPWKLNSLSAEPSHTARIVALLMYAYIVIKEQIGETKYVLKQHLEQDKYLWICFLWIMLSSGSSTALLFILIISLKFLNFRTLSVFLIGAGLLFATATALKVKSAERAYKVFTAALSLDEKTIIQADHSASYRIVPLLICAKKVNLTSVDGWFGHGVDNVQSFLYKLIPGTKKGRGGGGVMALWVEYGFVAFLTFIIFSLSVCYNRKDLLSLLFWLFLVFMYGANNQIVWLCMIILYTNKYFTYDRA